MECYRKKINAKNPLLATLSRPRRTMVRRTGPSRMPTVSAGVSLNQPADRGYGVPSRLDWNRNPPKPRINSYPPYYWDSAPPLASVGIQTSFESQNGKSQPASAETFSSSKSESTTTNSSFSERDSEARRAPSERRRSQTAQGQKDEQRSSIPPLTAAHDNSWLGSVKGKKSYQLEPWRFQTAGRHDSKRSPLTQQAEWEKIKRKDDLESARDLIRIALDPSRSARERSRKMRRGSASLARKTIDIQTETPAKRLPPFSFYVALENTWPGSLNGQKSYQLEPWRYQTRNKHDEKRAASFQLTK